MEETRRSCEDRLSAYIGLNGTKGGGGRREKGCGRTFLPLFGFPAYCVDHPLSGIFSTQKKKYRVSALWIFFSHVMATMGPTSGPLDGRIMDYAGKGIGMRAHDSNIFILNTFETSYFVVSP